MRHEQNHSSNDIVHCEPQCHGFYTKDTKRFDTDKQYAGGRNSGFNKCSYQHMEEDAYGGGRR